MGGGVHAAFQLQGAAQRGQCQGQVAVRARVRLGGHKGQWQQGAFVLSGHCRALHREDSAGEGGRAEGKWECSKRGSWLIPIPWLAH